ncbi:MAG: hypothetical protein V7L25_29925 [Nostoc sp.]|uniref:hypothetical protein n=1 Tax=Nostoc sp. TaxID=1180 RepID=UPI002FF194F1
MENFEPKETREWGSRGAGSREQGAQGKEVIFNSPPCTQQRASLPLLPNPPYPIPKTQLLLYLVPIIGFFPSLWTLYRGQGSREQLAISRLSITLALTWLLGYLLLATGAATSDFLTLRLFILNSFLTSGYFLVSVWLILRLMQGKSGRLPGFSTLAERVLGKYLS